MDVLKRALLATWLLSAFLPGLSCSSGVTEPRGEERDPSNPALRSEFDERVAGFNRRTGARQIAPDELERRLEAGEPLVILDVRTPAEHEVAALAGARLVRPGEVEELDLGPLDPDSTVVTYCTVGYRSGIAAVQLEKRLDRPVFNLDGGIIRWFNSGGEVVDPGTGQPAGTIHPFDEDWGKYIEER